MPMWIAVKDKSARRNTSRNDSLVLSHDEQPGVLDVQVLLYEKQYICKNRWKGEAGRRHGGTSVCVRKCRLLKSKLSKCKKTGKGYSRQNVRDSFPN